MIEHVRKRDGTVVPFDQDRIVSAIGRALAEVGKDDRALAEELALRVVKTLEGRCGALFGPPHVEEIQDAVEEVLMAAGLPDAARAYIVYRHQHQQLREVKELVDPELVASYVNGQDWRVRENSNMSFSLQGLNVFLTEKIIGKYWLTRVYPEHIRKAHVDGDFHIHDLGTLGPYCVGWDLGDLLAQGFRGARGKVESLPPKHFRVALLQAVNFLYTLQGEAAGAQAFSALDTLLAPFIAVDGLSYTEVKQALQEFVYNLNVPTRVGFQTPFSNVTLDLRPPEHLANLPAIVGGKPIHATYGEFTREMNLFNRALAEVMAEGDARGRVFTFPIPTYNVTPDFPWDDPTLEPLWAMTAKYGIPYFANFVNSEMRPEDARSMCCRLRLDVRELRRRGGGLFGSNPLTGSIGVVTLNLPRLAYLSRDEHEFLDRLHELMQLAGKSLIIKRKVLERLTDQGLYPYSKFYLRGVKEPRGEYWAQHFSTIGVIGMNEATLNLLGCTLAEEEGIAFALRVLDFMREVLVGFQEATGHPWNLEATPAEGTSYRLAMVDKDRHPGIVVANERAVRERGAAPYYTNSSQLPVDATFDLFAALRLQEPLQTRYTGGTVFHVWLGERLPSPEAVKSLVAKVMGNFRIPYLTLTPTFSVCPAHGYLVGEQERCPTCGALAEVYSRVVGYLRPVEQWNAGKQSEFRDRKMFHPTLTPGPGR
ncbi:MAG: ribonucleoside triphosphate reductase [Candidatus Acetothermia bacterium]|jgi:ribonucleoside-triphosphate reductase|nr:ribonucleoside triphosphate reductase [Candidatus Acetothermia bacterium]